MRRLPSKPASEEYKAVQYRAQKIIERRIFWTVISSWAALLFLLINFFFGSSLWTNFKKSVEYKTNGIDCEITVPDFEYGNSIFIRCNNKNTLIDSGTSEHKNELTQFLKNKKVSLLENYYIYEISDGYENVVSEIIECQDINTYIVPPLDESEGFNNIDSLIFQTGKFHINSHKGYGFGTNNVLVTLIDEEKIAMNIAFGDNKILFWNGNSQDDESDFLASDEEMDYDVLIVGKDKSVSAQFVESLKVEFVVSADEISDDIKALSIDVYSTFENGEITIMSNEFDIEIQCENQ